MRFLDTKPSQCLKYLKKNGSFKNKNKKTGPSTAKPKKTAGPVKINT